MECAGGRVLQHSGGQPCDEGEPVRYNKPNLLNPFFVVYGKVRQGAKMCFIFLTN